MPEVKKGQPVHFLKCYSRMYTSYKIIIYINALIIMQFFLSFLIKGVFEPPRWTSLSLIFDQTVFLFNKCIALVNIRIFCQNE